MEYLSSASEWLQRHAVHLLLRHGLSHVFANQVDLDQFQVQLRRHALRKCMTWHGKLVDIEISKEFLNQQAVPLGLEVERAVVGSLEVAISFTGPSLTVRLSDLHVHAKPHTPSATLHAAEPQTRPGSADDQQVEPDLPEAMQDADAAPAAVTRSLLDHLKPMAAAVERMLNTVSCCVDRLQVHLHLPCTSGSNSRPTDAPQPTAQRMGDSCNAGPAHPEPWESARTQASHAQRRWCVVLSVGSLKLVDTSDCFMAPLGVAGDAATTLDPDRAVEVSKSLFWDDLSMRIVPDDELSAPYTPSPSPAASTADAAGTPSPPARPGVGEAAQRAAQNGEQSAGGSVDAGEPDVDAVQRCAEDGCGMEGGASSDSFRAAAGRSGRGDTSSDSLAGGCRGSADGGASPVMEAGCGEGGSDGSDGEYFRDAEEQPEGGPQEQDGAGEGIMLLTGAGDCGWRGKATLQLGWAPAAQGGALRSARAAVESCEGGVVAVTAEQVAGLAEAVAALADVAEQQAHAWAAKEAGPPVALADVTASMLGALRPGQGMQDVLAMAAEDAGPGGAPPRPGAASCMTEMHDARSMLASSMMATGEGDQSERPEGEPSFAWQLRLDLQAPIAESDVTAAVPALSVSIWDAAVPVGGSQECPVGLCLQVGSITARVEKGGAVPLKVSSRLQGVQLLECLSKEIHDQHGGALELQTAAAIPELLHVTPPAPAAAPCATMDTPPATPPPAPRYPVPQHLHGLLPGAADATFAWPLVAPALPAHRTCRCALATDKVHADVLTLRLPPYTATLPTASLPLVVQLAGRVGAAGDAAAATRRGGASSSQSDVGLDAWGSMIPGASVPSTQQRRPIEILVTLPRLFCALLAEPTPPKAQSVWSCSSTPRTCPAVPRAHLVLDVRCTASAGCPANDPPPLLKVMHDPHRSRPLHADAAASSISMLLVSSSSAGMRAHCIAAFGPPPRSGTVVAPADASTMNGRPPSSAALRLFVSLQTGAHARCGVIGDPVSCAWLQANAHCRRDWQLGTCPMHQPAASMASTYAPPAAGVLFPVAFSAEEVEEAAHAGSTAVVSVRAPHLSAFVSEEQMAGLTVLLGTAIARVRVPAAEDAPPVATAAHVAVNVAAAGRVSIQRADGRTDVDFGRVACVLGQGIGGVAGAMVVHLTATGMRIVHRSPDEESPATLLFHIPSPSPGQGSMPRLEMVSTSQPVEQQPSVGALRTRTLTSHHIKRATFGTLAGDLSLAWLNRLSDLFQLPAPSMPAPVAISESSTHLSLEDCALGYMPAAAPPAATQSLHAAAFLAFARGLHTYTVGSARHVDVTSAHVAIGRVRSGGLAPWACNPPAAGWSVQTCAALGLDVIALEDAVSVVLDASAPVDSDAADAATLCEAPSCPSTPPGLQLAALEHHVIGSAAASVVGGPTADPLLAHVQQRRAADERAPVAVAAVPPLTQLPDLGTAPARKPAEACRHGTPMPTELLSTHSTRHAEQACGVSVPPPVEPPGSGCSGYSVGARVFGGSPGDSDVEVLSGRDACMMAITRLQLRRLSIMLTPDSCTLVNSLAEQLAASLSTQGADRRTGGGTTSVAGATTEGGAGHSAEIGFDAVSLDGSHASACVEARVEQHPATLDVHVAWPGHRTDLTVAGCDAACSESEATSAGAPAWPEERSELRFQGGGSSRGRPDRPGADADVRRSDPHLGAEPAAVLPGSGGRGGSAARGSLAGALSSDGGTEPIVQDMALSGAPDEDDMSSSGHTVGLSSSPGTRAPATDSSAASPVVSPALDQTLFVDASSTLIASTVLGRSDVPLSSPDALADTDAGAGRQPGAALLPPNASPHDIMHDMMLAGGSVIAVGTCGGARDSGRGLSSAGIPTEQEADGVVLPELQGTVDGLLATVMDAYVGAEAAPLPLRLQEPVTGRLGVNYPDSCQRVSVAAQSVTVLLRPDGVSTANLAAALHMRGGGLVRLQVAAVRVQHDVFPESVASHMRVVAAARSITAQQAGFGARGKAMLRKDGTVQWRPLATQLQHGPSDPRRDVLRMLLRVNDTEHGTREASAWLRLPSLRLHLEQPCLVFLRDFDSGIKRQREQAKAPALAAAASEPGSPRSLGSGPATPAFTHADGDAPLSGPAALAASTDSCTLLVSFDEPPAAAATMHNVLFRTVEMTSFVMAVDYIPTSTDYAALREGSLFELVNLVNWNNVRVEFKAASLQRVHGAEALLRLLAARWLADIRSNQAIRVLEGATPVASFVRLGTAVHRLAAHAATMPIATQRLSRPEREETVVARRQLHRNARYLLHTLTLEALGLGAWVAGGTAGLLGVEVPSTVVAGEAAERGNVFLESADLIRKEVGAALFALLSRPATAMQQGQGLHGAAWAAATAVPQAIRRPLGATAAAMQRTCIGMQHAVEYTLPPS